MCLRYTLLHSTNHTSHLTCLKLLPPPPILLQQMFGYSTNIRSATQGKGEFTMEYIKHAAVTRDKQETLIADFREKQAAKNK